MGASKTGGYLALPSAAARAEAFQDAAQTLVYDVLMLKVRFVGPQPALLPIYSQVILEMTMLCAGCLEPAVIALSSNQLTVCLVTRISRHSLPSLPRPFLKFATSQDVLKDCGAVAGRCMGH